MEENTFFSFEMSWECFCFLLGSVGDHLLGASEALHSHPDRGGAFGRRHFSLRKTAVQEKSDRRYLNRSARSVTLSNAPMGGGDKSCLRVKNGQT